MNQQPTAILLLFTDYLNNRDSIAFLRLSSSIWSSHRSPSGRYRLKNFLRPSELPEDFLCFPLSSPSAGHFSLFSLAIEAFDDFSLLSEAKQGKIRLEADWLENFQSTGRKFPDNFECLSLSGNCPLRVLMDFLPLGVRKLDFSGFSAFLAEAIEFSRFSNLESLTLWRNFDDSAFSLRH